jgi:hypothetical protein
MSEIEAELVEVVEEHVKAPARRFADRHPRVSVTWDRARPFATAALYGAAFAGGALLLSRFFGGRVATKLGEQGGAGFVHGVAEAQAAIRGLERGARFG